MKILFITKHIPYHQNSGITARINNLLSCLSRVCKVVCSFIVYADKNNEDVIGKCSLNLTNYLIETKRASFSPLRYISNLLGVFFVSNNLKTALSAVINKEKPDLVWLEFGYLCHFVPFLRKFGMPVIYGSHNSQFKLDFAIWKANTNILSKLKMAPFVFFYLIHERLFFTLPDLFFCISREDLSYYSSFIPRNKLRIMPFFFDDRGIPPIQPFTTDYPYVCMVGSLRSYQNYSAAIFALEMVWPILRHEHSRLHLYVIGEQPPERTPEYRRLMRAVGRTERVVMLGMVESVIPLVKGAQVNLVPLSIGSGVRTKIIESAACRTPVVSTTIGAEGLPFIDGESIFIADTGADLAEKVLRLVNDSRLRDDMAEMAYRKYSEELSCEAGARLIAEILDDLDLSGKGDLKEERVDARSGVHG